MARIVRHLHRQNRFSRGLAADWTEQNPVLFEGEVGWETDTERAKVGDGVTAWTSLAYAFETGGTDLSAIDFLVGTATGDLSAEIAVGTTPGGELGGTWASPTVDATHAGSTHSAATDTHIADATDAHDASAISLLDSAAQYAATEVESALAEIMDALQTHEGAADPHTGYRLESADHTHASSGAQAGQLDHGTALTGLTDDDHTQYRLESADHTHQSTGAQAGQLDHGLALTGLTDDDHTQYILKSLMDAKGDIIVATADNTPARLAVGSTDGHVLTIASGQATGLEWAAASAPGSSVAVEEDNASVGTATTLDFGTGLDVAFAAGEADITVDLSEVTAFTDHSARHENGGADEISIAGLDGTPVELTNHAGAADPHTGYVLESLAAAKGDIYGASADNTPAITTVGADGRFLKADSGQATGLAWEDHTGAADPHTGYRLESADHTHASSGAQAGTLDHGTALTGLTDDDHTQYLKETDVAAKGDQYVASANDTVAVVSVGTNGQRWTPSSGDAEGIIWADDDFTVGGVMLDPSGARTVEVWRAPFACEITAYHARVVGGTNAVTNAQVDSTDILTGDLTTTPADGWEAGTIKSDGTEDITAGEVIKLELVSISGSPTEISWCITLRRAA